MRKQKNWVRPAQGMNRDGDLGGSIHIRVWKGFAVVWLSDSLDQGAKLPVLSTYRLRYCKSFFDGRPIGRVFQDMLGP